MYVNHRIDSAFLSFCMYEWYEHLKIQLTSTYRQNSNVSIVSSYNILIGYWTWLCLCLITLKRIKYVNTNLENSYIYCGICIMVRLCSFWISRILSWHLRKIFSLRCGIRVDVGFIQNYHIRFLVLHFNLLSH